jgi:phosphoribosyl 1,2-cyclic phosphodiesterase
MEIKVLASSSKGNAYYVTDGVTPLLLECGIPFKKIQQRLNFKTSVIAGCLITHEHKDHSNSARDIIKAGINIYTSQCTLDALVLCGHRVKPIKAKEQFTIGTWTILPFDTEHDCAEPLGFLLANQQGEKLLYATDTYYVRYKFPGLTHIMVECNYSIDILNENVAAGIVPAELKKRLLKSHFSIDNVKQFLLANDLSKLREVHLIHLSESNSDAERFKKEVSEITGKPTYISEQGGEKID